MNIRFELGIPVTYSETGNKGKTFLEIELDPKLANKLNTPAERLFHAQKESVVRGFKLIEIEIYDDGSERIHQEFFLTGDVAFCLFEFFIAMNKEKFPELY